MTLPYRLLIALFGALVAIAPTATVKVVIEEETEPGSDGPNTDAPVVREVRPVVLKGAGTSETRLEIRAEERDPDPETEAEPSDPDQPVPVRRPARTVALPRLDPPTIATADVRAGLLGLPPPATRNA